MQQSTTPLTCRLRENTASLQKTTSLSNWFFYLRECCPCPDYIQLVLSQISFVTSFIVNYLETLFIAVFCPRKDHKQADRWNDPS